MKPRRRKSLLTNAHWDVLTVLFVSLTVVVCLIYAVVFAYPNVLPMQLQAATRTPTPTAPNASTTQTARPFPTFPAEWTAVFATRRAPPTATQAPSSSPTGLSASAAPTTATRTPTVEPTLAMTITATVGAASTPVATTAVTEGAGTATPATVTPQPATPSPTSNPDGYPGDVAPQVTPLDGYP